MRPVTLVRAPPAQTFCLQSPITQVVCRHSRFAHGRVMPPEYIPGAPPAAAPPCPAVPASEGLKVKPGSPAAPPAPPRLPPAPALPPLPEVPETIWGLLGQAAASSPTTHRRARPLCAAMSMLLRSGARRVRRSHAAGQRDVGGHSTPDRIDPGG